MDPSECCYYTCDECGVTLDVDCVLGEFSYLKVGHISPALDVVANNGLTRPLCSGCKSPDSRQVDWIRFKPSSSSKVPVERLVADMDDMAGMETSETEDKKTT
ncbi:unnamed protein product [Microthlaspi erraticum]|uniref:DC1 domain-containing protein n=1 Tax=Microthlaspi erraticum TaxID=1685480 RepID=A0A6D2JFY3_9BRAS|nr:unnamed protein product [Microthlaspi erraticum]